MLTLAIETSNPSSWTPGVSWRPGVCIGESGPGHGEGGVAARALGVEPVAVDEPGVDDLLPAVDRLTRRLGLAPHQLDRVTVSVGPGGFTAVRIAVSAGQMIAEATGARAIAVPTAMVVAARAPRDIPAPFGVALSSKGPTAHVTVFAGPGFGAGSDHGAGPRAGVGGVPSFELQSRSASVISAAELASLGVRALIADRFFPAAMRDEAARLGVAVHEPVFDPAACFEVSLGLEPVDAARLLPVYPREPEAVTKWRQLQRSRTSGKTR